MRYKITEEEKIAQKLSAIVSDLRIDLDQVGVYLARSMPSVAYRRLIEIAESAQFEREQQGIRLSHQPLF